MFSPNNTYFCKCQNADGGKKSKEDEQTFEDRIKFGSLTFASEMSVSTNQLH